MGGFPAPSHPERSAEGAESKDRVPGMAGSLEVKVLFPTWWR